LLIGLSGSVQRVSKPPASGKNQTFQWPAATGTVHVGKPRTQEYRVVVARDDEALVTIATFTTSFEASLARGALEAAGIAAVVPGEESGTFSTYSRNHGDPTVSVLQVLESDRDRAIAELGRMQMRIADPGSD
jgi:hypothetical protein